LFDDYGRQRRTRSTKRRTTRINGLLKAAIWLCLSLSAVLMLTCAVAYISNNNIFEVNRITIKGTHYIRPAEIMARTGLKKGDNIFRWNVQAARTSIANHPWVSEVRITRLFIPAQVRITVIEQRPVATLYLNGRRYLLNRDGQIFAPAGRFDFGTKISTSGYVPSIAELRTNIEKSLSASRILYPRKVTIIQAIFDASGCITFKLNNGLDLICLDRLTEKKANLAVMAINRYRSTGKTVIDLTCEDKIVLRDRITNGS